MKKFVYKGLAVFVYLIFLIYVTGFQIDKIFDLKSFVAVAIGMLLLTFSQGIHRRDKEEVFNSLAWNAIVSGYISTIIFLFAMMSDLKEIDKLISEMALNCRSIIYGVLFYVIIRRDNEKQVTGNYDLKKGLPDEILDKVNRNNEMTAEQMYFHFRSIGLTQREAEIARLLYNNLTNNEIASELYISETTVKKHVSHIFEKLGIEKRDQIRSIELHL